MKRALRTLIALIVLTVSLALLIWGFWPTRRETLVTPINPCNLTLPTPSSFFLDPEPGPWTFA